MKFDEDPIIFLDKNNFKIAFAVKVNKEEKENLINFFKTQESKDDYPEFVLNGANDQGELAFEYTTIQDDTMFVSELKRNLDVIKQNLTGILN